MQITSTPWGTPDTTTAIARGITFLSTPSHGGFHLEPEQNGYVPREWRAASFNGRAADGWYEEDCDWCMVVLTFPAHFTKLQQDDAARMFRAIVYPKLQRKAG